jgi:hypothetical protein
MWKRQNLNMRMGMRRFTRLTNAFSKKLEPYRVDPLLHVLQLCPRHQTLRCTPAMAARVRERLSAINDVIRLLEEYRAHSWRKRKPRIVAESSSLTVNSGMR